MKIGTKLVCIDEKWIDGDTEESQHGFGPRLDEIVTFRGSGISPGYIMLEEYPGYEFESCAFRPLQGERTVYVTVDEKIRELQKTEPCLN